MASNADAAGKSGGLGLDLAHRFAVENSLATNRALVEFQTLHLVRLATEFTSPIPGRLPYPLASTGRTSIDCHCYGYTARSAPPPGSQIGIHEGSEHGVDPRLVTLLFP
jgi:hypothetical protein